MLCFKKEDKVAPAFYGKLLDAAQSGILDGQSGFFSHFPDYRIYNGLSGFYMTAGWSIAAPVCLDPVLQQELFAPVDQAQNGQLHGFSVTHSRIPP